MLDKGHYEVKNRNLHVSLPLWRSLLENIVQSYYLK